MDSGEQVNADQCEAEDDTVLTPFVGKTFATLEDGKLFYNNYAFRMDFSIREGPFYKSTKSAEVTSRRYLCSMAGLTKKGKDAENSNERTPQKERAPTLTDCKASIRVRFVKSVWTISVFNGEHNHPLISSPSKIRNLQSHRLMNSEDRDIIGALRAQNVEAAKIHEYLGVTHGGKKNLKFKKKDISNEIALLNRKLVGVDVESTLLHFQKKQEADAEFFYDVEVDDNGRLNNIFWVDGRARSAFQEFGDVVTFDTTYQTNKWSMPLAIFVGVNHHRMNIYFGMAMLRSEDKNGFMWLFKTWIKAMYGTEPKAIIMDQDPEMKIAIKDILPNTIHRCCQWHVMRKENDHLGILYNLKSDFKEELQRIINRSMTVLEFEEGWRAMLQKFDLVSNRHLKVMFDKRSEWVPVYFRGHFFANMSTSQRSESANSALKIWTDSHASMYNLVLHVEKIVEAIWQKESDEDIKCMKAVFKNTTLYLIEKEAFDFYTCEVMKEFKKKLTKSQLGKVKEIEKNALYEVTIDYHPMIGQVVEEIFMVKINILEEEVSCNCNGYVFDGLLCSHAIKVMHHVGMLHLPNRYVMKRWCKDANASVKRSRVERSLEFGSTQEQESLRVATLKSKFNIIMSMAAKSSVAFTYLTGVLSEAKEKLQEINGDNDQTREEDGAGQQDAPTVQATSGILDPPISQCKRKRKPQRLKPPSEQWKPRKCGICGSIKGGHNARTCPI